MRTHAYPDPPSLAWSTAMTAAYAALAIAGVLVLAALMLLPQPPEGTLVLGLWGGLTVVATTVCLCGVLLTRYRMEWVGCWLIVMATSIYLVVTILGTLAAGPLALFTSAPTILVFAYAILITLGRAVQLSLIDMQARKQVQIEKALTGETPGVAAHD